MLVSPSCARVASRLLVRTRFHLTLLSALTAVPRSAYSSPSSSPALSCSAAFSRPFQSSHSSCQILAASNEPTAATAEETAMAAYVESDEIRETRELVSELCRQFYTLGWVSGTGGSICIKANEPDKEMAERTIVMAPSGVQKERMQPEDMYILAPDGSVLSAPRPNPPPHKKPKCSECGPLFMKCFELRNAGAVIHSHGMESAIVTLIKPGATEFRISHMEMIKGIVGHGYFDELVVPIIENTAREFQLTDSLEEAMKAYPKATAVLVRNHGVYIWGDNWIQAKTQAECYHYLFDAAIKMHQLGLDSTHPLHTPLPTPATSATTGPAAALPAANGHANGHVSGKSKFPPVIVLDIEGTTTPISFVSQVLFPFAKEHAREFLLSTYDTSETQEDIKLLREQIADDVAKGVSGAVPVPAAEEGKQAVVAAVAANVDAMIAADRKITALKQLQGHIWRVGYAEGKLKGEFFSDVLTALAEWTAGGSRVYIYSSGSREAQRLIFGYSHFGDLRRFISGFFDTTTGPKREAKSYSEIALSVGVDSPSQITFATDILQEAEAAKAAGLQAVLLSRPGNGPLPSELGFRVIPNLLEL